ncbi:hypothetical protein [Haloferula sp.]|uniref:hypothetical protein n=1 Tax=Haloferula sp. TaxID=2497595 RepID=UPI003C72D87F
MMILLTVIAVGLLTLSTVALGSSSQSLAIQEARGNARFALILAVGELQKYAGQDQRTTAVADIAGTADGLALDAGGSPINDISVSKLSKRLSPVQPGTRYWTGVFVNQDDPETIFKQSPTPLNIHWLVSGVKSSYSAANRTGSPNILPSDTAYAIGASGDVTDPSKAVVLVGENSVGKGAGRADQYVVAPLVNIQSKEDSNPTGRFAWWVGDEGVKATINLMRTRDDPTLYTSLSAQRRGWETIPGFSEYPTPSSPSHDFLPKITDLEQAALLVPSAGTTTGGASPLQSVFHSATAESRAVLSDPLHGGTKIDLTAVLAKDLPTQNPNSGISDYPIAGKPIIPKIAAPSMQAPLWDAVKEFQDQSKQLTGGSLLVQEADSVYSPVIAPVITDLRILMGAKMKPRNSSGNSYNINACGKIAIAIANPYSVTLEWKQDLEIQLINQTPYGNKPSRIFGLGNNDNTAFIPGNTDEPAVFNNTAFAIKPSSLAPGEARAYSLAGPAYRPRATATQRTVVNLAPFQTCSPFDFNNCVELENPQVITVTQNTPTMNVRESWQTTLVMTEMRLGGTPSTASPLRRIERLELDNGYSFPNRHTFSQAEARQMTQPFPMMLYSIQISQPGTDYKQVMPSTYEAGQRGSTLRTFADFNLRATQFHKPIASYNPPPFFMESNDSKAQLPTAFPGGDTGSGFTRNLALSPLPWGHSSFGSKQTVLFSIPSQVSSLAQLQHADLTGDDNAGSIGHQPGNAFANSYAPPFVERGLTTQSRTDYELVGSPNRSGTTNTLRNYYDISYLLNATLWDNYFFSSIPTGAAAGPENPSLIMLPGGAASKQLDDPIKAAGHLMIEGAFNVNSTDKNAWKAFLASSKHFKHAADTAANSDAAFPRSLEQTAPSEDPPTGRDTDSFSGFRRLTDSQLDALAEEIVKQVRLRGPFVSLSHFVNRALADITEEPALTRSGALQQALDESGANIDFDGSKNAFSDINATRDLVTLQWKNNAPRADMDGTDTEYRPDNAYSERPDWAATSTDSNFGSVASIVADQEMLKDSSSTREQGYRSTGIPGWLTQADVLQVIGSSLTTRSDTFRIRTFGESLDASGKTVARAYCEAVVQRVPNYIDASDAPFARGSSLSTLNQSYGRKFEIVSFRWLSPLEI